ncbi:hypothetical protein [Clostridium magnum]|uniref:Uncharacterized protein n=1 Tax=Clostridium magnum DSM 2767 TaxID=1121326 RepID=A0A168E0U3_9CLOT|nr:hypothetical protein [Clostridium magnum]KZL93527.1 hypothetical protein CLMAG_05730 [Clostridium magnum DSM 2767]SHJ68786.1 hypothetical protein SAMN02745944_06333 [Clostridium magnum DSM 2767]
MIPIEYDKMGRMKYHPEFHSKHGQPWSQEDLQYLIDWYYIIGPEEMSLALDRRATTISSKATYLTKIGVMKKPSTRYHHKRMWKR